MDKAAELAALDARIFAARLTAQDVCIKAGVAPSTISRWRKNPSQMTAPTLKRLEDALTEIERAAA